jgi:hypothetical protein
MGGSIPVRLLVITALEWQNGSRLEIKGRYLSVGTTPLGSTWSRNPIPYAHPDKEPEFEPPCAEKPDAWKVREISHVSLGFAPFWAHFR